VCFPSLVFRGRCCAHRPRESEDGMNAFEDDEEQSLPQRLQEAVAGAVFEAIAQLRQTARGGIGFRIDHELRACVTLARMARLLIVDVPGSESGEWLAHPDNSAEEVERLVCVLEGHEAL